MSCSACRSGTLHQGETNGEEALMHGLNTYVTRPAGGATPRGVIVYITDAYGWKFINNRLLADRLAQKGQLVVLVPDFMGGNALSTETIGLENRFNASGGIVHTVFEKPILGIRLALVSMPWVFKTRFAVCHPRVVSFITALRTSKPPFETKCIKVGVAGFCWGGKHAVRLAQNTTLHHVEEQQLATPLIDCAFTAHPSMLKFPEDFEKVELPLSIAVGDEDMMLSKKKAMEVKTILERRGEKHQVNIIPGGKHGFAVRLNAESLAQKKQAEAAERQALAFFEQWLV